MNKRSAFILILLAIGVLLAGCQPTPDDIRAELAADYPAVDGSTSAHPLTRLIACEIQGVPCTWSSNAEENVERMIVPAPEADPALAEAILGLEPSGTNGAYVALIEGRAELILVAREPSEDEIAAAEAAGVALDVQPAALDAFVFIVNAENPVEGFSIETLREIYTGEITGWAELGVQIDPAAAAPEAIHAYQRERNSGSQELMEDLVMQGALMVEAPDLITPTMLGPYNAIGGNRFTGDGDTLGLGYSIYYYAVAMFPHEFVRMVPIEGVLPSSETIASREYPLTTEVYVVIRGDTGPQSQAVRLRDWILSEEGQAMVAQSGYVPLR